MPDIEPCLPLHDATVLLGKVHDLGMARAIVDVFEKLAKGIVVALGLAFDLV